MPFYKVTVRQDAWIFHGGLVKAESEADAAKMAMDAWHGERADLAIPLKEFRHQGYDDAECVSQLDVEEVNTADAEAAIAAYRKSDELRLATDLVRRLLGHTYERRLDSAKQADWHFDIADAEAWLARMEANHA